MTEIIRTEYVLRNIFSYMLPAQYKFNTICARNQKEIDFMNSFKSTIKNFGDEYGDAVRNQCLKITTINENNIDLILTYSANEQFSEGITWSQIITFIYFVGELTRMVISRKLSVSLVDRIFKCFSTCVKEKLELWIREHDGWEGMKKTDVLVLHKPSKVQSLMYNFVKITGTLSNIGNILNGTIF